MSLPNPSTVLNSALFVDDVECVVCARKLVGLFVRMSTGVCALCEVACGLGGRCGQ